MKSIKESYREKSSRILFVCTGIILAGLALLLVISGSARKNNATNLSGRDLNIVTNVQFAPNGDKNKDGKINSGDDLRFSFTLTNKGAAQEKFIALELNLGYEKLFAIRSIEGASSFDADKKKLTFKNLVVLPGQEQRLSFVAGAIPQAEASLKINPRLLNQQGEEIARGDVKEYALESGKPVEGPNSTKVNLGGTPQ